MSTIPLAELVVQLERASAPAEPAAAGSDAAAAPVLSDAPRVADLLRQMQLIQRVTSEELRVTKAGLLVARLKKSTDADVANLAKQIVARWKAQVIAPAQQLTGVDQAKAAAAAAKQADARQGQAVPASTAAATAAPAAAVEKAAPDAEDSEELKKKTKRKAEKEAAREKEEKERGGKKKKSDVSPSPSPTPSQSSSRTAAAAAGGSLAAQHPELAKGTYALFQTEDMQRDKMQYILWQAIGEPPQTVLDQMAAQEQQAQGQDLSQYKARAEPSPSPPPIADVAISTPSAAATEGKESASAASPPPAVSAATAAAPVVFRTRQQLALQIEQAMFNMGKGNLYWANGTWYKQVSGHSMDSKWVIPTFRMLMCHWPPGFPCPACRNTATLPPS